MKIWILIHKAPIRVVRIKRKRAGLRLKRQMLMLKIALSQEKAETKAMLVIYRKYTQKQASKAELKIANEQFVDIVKGLGIGIFAVLPFSPVTIPVMIKLGKMVGVNILPSSFYSETQDNVTAKKSSNKNKL
jgi:hypothetical protein